jgi:hypothetical protein
MCVAYTSFMERLYVVARLHKLMESVILLPIESTERVSRIDTGLSLPINYLHPYGQEEL